MYYLSNSNYYFIYFSFNGLKEKGGKVVGEGLSKLVNLANLTLFLKYNIT